MRELVGKSIVLAVALTALACGGDTPSLADRGRHRNFDQLPADRLVTNSAALRMVAGA